MSTSVAEEILSKTENNHTGAYLVRWDDDMFKLSYIYSEKDKTKSSLFFSKTKKFIGHESTQSTSLANLFANEKMWKRDHDLKNGKIPERPLALRNLVGIFNSALYISSYGIYTMRFLGSSAPTQQEQLNIQKGLPIFEMIL